MEQSNKPRERAVESAKDAGLTQGTDTAEIYISGYEAAYDALQAENDWIKAECEEQARLNGMGSEREAKLQAEVERLTRLLAIQDSRASQFESTVTETMRVRDEALAECAKYREILKSVTTDIKQYSSAYNVVQWVLDRNEKARQALEQENKSDE